MLLVLTAIVSLFSGLLAPQFGLLIPLEPGSYPAEQDIFLLFLALPGLRLKLLSYAAVFFLGQACVTLSGFRLPLAEAIPGAGVLVPSLEGPSLEVRRASSLLPLALQPFLLPVALAEGEEEASVVAVRAQVMPDSHEVTRRHSCLLAHSSEQPSKCGGKLVVL